MAKRPYDATDVADWFINQVDRQAGEVITPLEVQRLVYFAQAWYLANKGRPLFKEDMQAWATGPIVPSVFERFEHYAYTTIPAIENAREITGEKLELLAGVHERYGCYRGRKLDELSREAGGPWEQARAGLSGEAASSNVISKEALREFYGEKIGKTWS